MKNEKQSESLDEIVARNPCSILNQKQLAVCLNRDVRSIRRMVRAGDLPAPAPKGRESIWIADEVLKYFRERMKSETEKRNKELMRLQSMGGA